MVWRSEDGGRDRGGVLACARVCVRVCVGRGSDKTRCEPSSIDTRAAVKMQGDRREAQREGGLRRNGGGRCPRRG